MKTRLLGASGIQVSEIGFGTWGIGGDGNGMIGYGHTEDGESMRALAEARAHGCTFFDTSNLYGWGHAEELLALAFTECRHEIVIATKAGYVSPDGKQDFSPQSVRLSVEGSLHRLSTDYVDVLQLHNPPREALEGNDALFGELERLQSDGLVRSVGMSARSPDEALVFAVAYHPAVLQVNFNLGDLRAWRIGLFETCAARSIGLIVRSPLAAGFLTGQLGATDRFSVSDHRQRYSTEARERWIDVVRRVEPVFADAVEATPAQNAIRFCLSFDQVSTVIAGMMSVSDVREDLAAATLPHLDEAQLREVASIYDAVFC